MQLESSTVEFESRSTAFSIAFVCEGCLDGDGVSMLIERFEVRSRKDLVFQGSTLARLR